MQTAYRVNLPRPTEDPRESSMILIVDTKQHRYFDTQANGRDIEFTSSSVFQTLLAVEMGKLSGKMSGTFRTRMIWVCFHFPCPMPSLHLSTYFLMIIFLAAL